MASRCSFGRECRRIMKRFQAEAVPAQTRPAWLGRDRHGPYESAHLLLMETIMLSPKRQFKSYRSALRAAKRRAAFTLSEIVIALAILGAMSSGVYVGFNSINTYAVSSRLYSEALTAPQTEIDLLLSKAPFDVNAAYVSGTLNPALGKIPAELMTPPKPAA